MLLLRAGVLTLNSPAALSLRRPPSEALLVGSKQNPTDGDARWKIPECWRRRMEKFLRKMFELNSGACSTRPNASVSEGLEQRGLTCPPRNPSAQVSPTPRPRRRWRRGSPWPRRTTRSQQQRCRAAATSRRASPNDVLCGCGGLSPGLDVLDVNPRHNPSTPPSTPRRPSPLCDQALVASRGATFETPQPLDVRGPTPRPLDCPITNARPLDVSLDG